MTKTFCDRCGKEITKEYGWIVHRKLYASITLLPWKKHEEWSNRADKYICPECEDSYIHWFMNPGTENRRRSRMKWEQFEQTYPRTQEFTNKILTDIECPKCGKNLFQRTDIVLTSYPAQYQYECECGFVGYSHAQWNERM